jgi:hypothetical protein
MNSVNSVLNRLHLEATFKSRIKDPLSSTTFDRLWEAFSRLLIVGRTAYDDLIAGDPSGSPTSEAFDALQKAGGATSVLQAAKTNYAVNVQTLSANASDFEVAYRYAYSTLELSATKLGVDAESLSSALRSVELSYDELMRQLALITPEHLVLQVHLETLIEASWPDADSITAAVELYSELFKLRDSYFATPKLETLNAYRLCAEELQHGSAYRELRAGAKLRRLSTHGFRGDKTDRLEKALTELSAELEVHSMLGAIT